MEEPVLGLRIRITAAAGQEAVLLLGPGRADLLALIQATGSIAAAGRRMGMSYKRAWRLVEEVNHSFAAPLVEASKGGSGGGGARLTEPGLEVLKAYRQIEQDCAAAAAAPLQRLQAMLVSTRRKSG